MDGYEFFLILIFIIIFIPEIIISISAKRSYNKKVKFINELSMDVLEPNTSKNEQTDLTDNELDTSYSSIVTEPCSVTAAHNNLMGQLPPDNADIVYEPELLVMMDEEETYQAFMDNMHEEQDEILREVLDNDLIYHTSTPNMFEE